MLFQKNIKKLEPRWRGPFQISGYGGSYRTSFRLQQLNRNSIPGTFHGDYLKTFVLRLGHLADPSDPPLPLSQTIRPPLPRARLFLRPPKPPTPPEPLAEDPSAADI